MALRDLVTGRLLGAETSREGDRVTTLELFFDLVFVFAFTQVTGLMSEGGDPVLAVVQGLGVLGTVWWAWTSFAWLSNQAHADRGVVRIALVLATALMFVVSLAIPESFHHDQGRIVAPLVFVAGVLLVSLVHGTVYTIAAGRDTALRRQIARSLGLVNLPVIPLLLIGALVGGAAQAWLWLAAPLVEFVIIAATSRGGDWRINSLAHFAERHGLVVILALGESVVAIGAGIAQGRGADAEPTPLDAPILVGATLSIAIALALWWCYFARFSGRVEHALGRRSGAERVAPTTDVYTYLHLPLVAGIIVAALGVETAMHGVGSAEALGGLGAGALGSGVALYLVSTVLVWVRVSGQWSLVRLLAAAVCLALIPLCAALPALAALAALAVVVVGLVVAEQVLGPRLKPALRRTVDLRAADPSS